MSHNKYIYRFCLSSEKALREAAGYKGGKRSTDGFLIVGDKTDKDTSLGLLTIPVKPDSITAPNWPFADHEEVLTAIKDWDYVEENV